MVTFLLTTAVIMASMVIGYRLNMYLYVRGAVGGKDRTLNSLQPVIVESFPTQPVREVVMRERDYGLRYARVGILIIVALVLMLAVGMAVTLFQLLF